VDREQIAKAAVAAGIFVLAMAAVFSFWFVLPSMDTHNAAFAQGEEGAAGGEGMAGAPGGPGGEAGGMGAEPGMGGGMPGMGGEMGGGMPGMGGEMGGGMPGMGGEMGGGMPGAGGGGGAPSAAPAPPLEPSRANPFVPVDTPEPEDKFVTSQSTYGPKWDTIPLGYGVGLPQPELPQGAPVALPPNPSASADLIRISAIVWPADDVGAGAAGRAFATWEGPDGRTRLAKPGQELVVGDPVTEQAQRWRVVSIRDDRVILRNPRTGESVQKRTEARSRGERQYSGRRSLADDAASMGDETRVLPGRGTSLPGGTAGAAAGAAGGMGMGGEGGMGMGPEMGAGMGMMPGMPGGPAMMGAPGGR